MSPDRTSRHTAERGEYTLPQGRLYISCPVLTPDPLIRLQTDLILRPDFKPALPEKFHITLFHFGKPYDVYQDVLKENPNIGPDELEGYHRHLISQLLAHISYAPFEVECTGVGIDVFGDSTSPVVVVTLAEHEKIVAARKQFLHELESLLRACRIGDIERFIQGNPDLMYQPRERYQPHVTVGSIDRVGPLPQISSPIEHTRITLGTPQLIR